MASGSEVDGDLTVVHEDDDVLVLDKPAGLLSAPGRGEDKQDCLVLRAQARWPEALLVHRLDQATSGLLLLARGPEMQRTLSMCFAARQVHKRYEAVVDGWVHGSPGREDEGEIDLPLLADWPRRPRQKVDVQGKPSLTRWQVLAREERGQTGLVSGRSTRLALFPVTGRSHQLRVHLQAIGHPILGDALYADADSLSRSPRLLLHACELSLRHPRSGALTIWNSPPPF
ncbi:pseudouridine synthase [Hylemonella gracilis str. Niagara R]|uniref:Dual-specificity RNA pseudouridine synthase RluA n=1 Tax=Hylemonella gracilis str. Niagara R TaxID=1458275 RepID=A0A016XLQ9_9BURK|nr:RluA family pseudouridine synthase [Hylemonella gracilis]EYC52128.1 pseudouridine synthase [Hylemonella gracilis str. Niagara R]